MRLEWIEDLLAVLKAGSLKRAAEERFLSQPAFSRRIKSIEDYVGVALIDRTKKPVQLHETLRDQQPRLEELATEIRDLLYELRQRDRKAKKRVIIVGQHATIATMAPALIKHLTGTVDAEIVLRSANRDECFFMLATNQADLALIYRCKNEALPLEGYLIEECDLGSEALIPVFAKKSIDTLNASYRNGEVSIIAYPPDVFLGQVTNREIFPSLKIGVFLRTRAETALTLAALQLASEGVGVGWVPQAVAAKDLSRGELVDLSRTLLSAELSLCAVRIGGRQSTVVTDVWQSVVEQFESKAAG